MNKDFHSKEIGKVCWTFLIIMKATFFLIILFSIKVSAEAYSQNITLSSKNAPMERVIQDLRKQSGTDFIFDPRSLRKAKPVTVDLRNVPLGQALEKIFRDQPFTYELFENSIIIKPEKSLNTAAGAAPDLQKPAPALQTTVSGTVTDSTGAVLPGVAVQVKGRNNGTLTDERGRYSLEEIDDSAVLVFSMLGFETREISVDGQSEINIVMRASMDDLKEVVVVGYGTQRKVNLTGAIEMIDNENLTDRPLGNLGQALQGASPGLNVFTNNSGGQPDATMNINIRGLGSPFVLVDGLPVNINNINPQDIESIAVIKDASAAAIYGANAPYGVILITTKRGSSEDGRPRLSYNNTLTMGTPTKLPEPVNSLDFAAAVNDATVNAGNSPYFSEAVMERIRQYIADPSSIPAVGPDPIDPTKWAKRENANGNTNWYDEILKPWAFRQKHDLSLTGGNDNFNYYVSLGFFDHQGQVRYADEFYQRYNIDAKVSTKVTEWLNVNFLTKFSRNNIDYPNDGYGLDRAVMWHDFPRRFPTDPVRYPNGTWSEMSRFEIFQNGGREKHNNNDFWTKLEVEISPLKGWQIKGDYGWNSQAQMSSLHRARINAVGPQGDQYIHFDTTPLNSISKTHNNNTYWNANIYSSYERTLGGHNFKLLLGHQRESGKANNLYAYRDNLLTDEVPSLSTSTGTVRNDDNVSDWATMGTFARLNYDFRGKYLFEFNGRYQGSSRFERESRFGFFPSVSVGYRISEEPFWAGAKRYVNDLKLRVSYGSLGNHNVANFLYLPVMPVQSQVSWINGNEAVVGVGAPGLTSSLLTWETIATIDAGVDATFLNNRLDMTFDYFKRTVSDMFGTPNPLPSVLGTGVPQENNAEQENSGWELSFGWKDRIGAELNYYVRLGLSDYKTVITKWNNPDKLLSQNYEGKTIGEIWGYTSNGLFQSESEVASSASQSLFFANWHPGDVKYEDINSDGVIDFGLNTLDNHGDMQIIGNSSPRYLYNFSLGMSYRNFDFSMLWNGVGKQDVWFDAGANVFWFHVDHVWAINVFEEHTDYYREGNENAFWPRPYISGETYKNRRPSTRYLESASYLRLKNLQIGYVLPQQLSSRISVSRLRVFFNAENLLTFTDLIGFLDPEATGGDWGQGKMYPLQKTLSLGINANF